MMLSQGVGGCILWDIKTSGIHSPEYLFTVKLHWYIHENHT